MMYFVGLEDEDFAELSNQLTESCAQLTHCGHKTNKLSCGAWWPLSQLARCSHQQNKLSHGCLVTIEPTDLLWSPAKQTESWLLGDH